MIRKFSAKNYKKFIETGEIPFSKITMFVGTNSSGKSSFIKSLILLSDNLMNRNQVTIKNSKSNKVFFGFNTSSCDNVNLGTFKRVVNNDTESDLITFEANFFEKEDNENLDLSVRVEVQNDEEISDLGYISRVLIIDNMCGASFNFNLKNWTAEVEFPAERYYALEHEVTYGKYTIYNSDEYTNKEEVLHFNFPIKPEALSGELLVSLFHNIIYESLPHTMSSDTMTYGGKIEKGTINPCLVLEGYWHSIMAKIRSSRNFPDIEYIYAHAITRKVIFSINDKNDYVAQTIHEAYTHKTLYNKGAKDFINYWLSRFKIGTECKISTIEGEGYIVHITDDKGHTRNLVDIGTGSAQIVLLLLKVATIMTTSISKLIVVEEPEQNLHPNYQSLLADLFYNIQDIGVRMIIETHSEYLIRRSQVIVALLASEKGYNQKEIDENNPFRVIYFPESGKPYDMHYKVNGDFEHLFGEGFFDAAAKNRVELYKMQLDQNR